MLAWADEVLGEPVVVCAQSANATSRALAERLGFSEVARFEEFGAEQWFGLRQPCRAPAPPVGRNASSVSSAEGGDEVWRRSRAATARTPPMSLSIRLAGIAATGAIALGGAFGVAAHADDAPATVPCAQQQAKVDKAEGALERVSAVFARQQERVEKVKKVVAAAEAGREKAAARRALAAARQDRKDTKVTKRAQQQRLAKAQERLITCQAAQTTEAPAPA